MSYLFRGCGANEGQGGSDKAANHVQSNSLQSILIFRGIEDGEEGRDQSVLEREGARRVGGEDLEYVLAQTDNDRVTVVFQKYGDSEGSNLGFLASSELRVAGEHHGKVLHDQAEYLRALAEVGCHVDESLHQGREQRH